MKRSALYFFLITTSLLVLSACSSAAQATATTSNFQPGSQSGTPLAPPQGASQSTAAAPVPTETQAPTSAATATSLPLPTLTPTPVTVNLTVISGIGCVNSPSESAAFAGVVKTGAVLTALGRNDANTFYYIENPSVAGGHCWIWNNYVLINGISSNLPVMN
jgi:predicted flap endonuclease-1-like 5' DNA nuclease